MSSASAAVPAVLQFHDVSHWNAGYTPKGPLLAKATQGSSYIDPSFSGFRRATLAGGWPFAAYHYVDTSDPIEQAKHCLSVVGADTPVMWDIERGGGSFAHLLAVHDAFVRLGGHARLVYLPHWYWQGSLGSPSLAPLAQRGLALVSSDYLTAYSATGPGWTPYGGMTPVIWQWSDAASADTDAFRGTQAELATLLAVRGTAGATPPVPKPVHEVQPGETMASIARAWHVTLQALEAANPRAGHPAGNFDLIRPGDVLHHP